MLPMDEHGDDLETGPIVESGGQSDGTRIAAAVASGLEQIAAALERGLREIASAIASADAKRHASKR